MDANRAQDELPVPSSQGVAHLVEEIADRLAGAATVTAVYGNPVERRGTTVIPVAHVRYGFGGGGGRKASKGEEGTGGGGGVQVAPVGYIEMDDDHVRFRRIQASSPLRALGLALLSLFAARGLLRIAERRRLRRFLTGLSRDRHHFARRWKALHA